MPERIDLTEAPLPKAPPRVVKPGRGTGKPKWDAAAQRVLTWSAGIAALLLLYLLWGLWSGAWSHEALRALPASRRAEQAANIALVFQALVGAALVSIAALLVCAARAEGVGYWLLGTAATLYLAPGFVAEQLNAVRHQRPGGASLQAVADLQELAWFFAVPGAMWTLVDLGRRLGAAAEIAATQRVNAKYGQGTPKQKVSAQRKVFLGRCWEGPFCQDVIRVKCPIYLKKRGPCWWYKEGCMCEERIVLQAMISPDWKDQMTRAHHALSLGTGARKYLSPEAKRERCRNCVIYNEHQREKHKLLSIVVLVASPMLLYLNFSWLQTTVHTLLLGMDAATKRFSFGADPAGITALHNGAYSLIAWVFVFALAVILLSQTLKVVEWWCFKLKM